MSGQVLRFPAAPAEPPGYEPPELRRELARIEHWAENASAGLARLDSATRADHLALRALADALRHRARAAFGT